MNQCNLLTCAYGEECSIDKQGITECVCPSAASCERVVRPVCASDGNTYDNECEMRAEGCRKKEDVTVEYFGICGELVGEKTILLIILIKYIQDKRWKHCRSRMLFAIIYCSSRLPYVS